MAKCKSCLHFDVCEKYEATVDFDVDDGVCLYYEHQIVRCKECIHSYDDLCGLCCTCGPYVDCVVQPEFYCADGKRRARGVE